MKAFQNQMLALKEAADIIKRAACAAEVEEITPDDMDEATGIMLWAMEQLDRAKDDLEYLARPTKAGRLYQNDRDRFVFESNDMTVEHELTCGYRLEAFFGEEWHTGRVEHGPNGYYFHGGHNPLLQDLNRVRVRLVD